MDMKIVNAGVDTLIVNCKFTNEDEQLNGDMLPEQGAARLDAWQALARKEHEAVPTDLLFSYSVGDEQLEQTLMLRPHGEGVWSWLLYSDDVKLSMAYGSMNGGVFCQARFSSHLLWSIGPHAAIIALQACLYAFIEKPMHVQASEVHLCCDVQGWDVAHCDWQQGFVSRVVRMRARPEVPMEQEQEGGMSPTDIRELETLLERQLHDQHNDDESDEVMMPYPTTMHRRISTLDFGSHGSAISCQIYNKSEEVKTHKKQWFYPIWQANGWDGVSTVFRIEIRVKRKWLASYQLNEAFGVLLMLSQIWSYATTEWLRYVDLSASADRNKSRLPTHAAWALVQSAYAPAADERATRDEAGERAVRLDYLVDAKPLQVLEQAAALNKQAEQETVPLADDDPDGRKRQHEMVEHFLAVRKAFLDVPLDIVRTAARKELATLSPEQVSRLLTHLLPEPFETVQARLVRRGRTMAKRKACIAGAVGYLRSAVALAGDEVAGVRPGASVQEKQAVLPDWQATLIWFLEQVRQYDASRGYSHKEEVLKKRLAYGFVTAQALDEQRRLYGVDLLDVDRKAWEKAFEQAMQRPADIYLHPFGDEQSA